MFSWKKATGILCAAAVAASLVGCGQSTAEAMTIDGVSIPAGLYIYYEYAAYYEMTSTLSEQDPDLDISDEKTIKSLYLDDLSTEDWVRREADKMCQTYAAIVNECDALGLELDAEEKREVTDTIDSFWESYGESYEDNGISSNSVQLMLENSYLEEKLFYYYFEVDGDKGVTEEEVHEYYVDNNARVHYIRFDLVDGNGEELDSDGKEDMLEMVSEYLATLEESEGDEEALMVEMDTIQEEYDAYVTSISEEAVAATATVETDEDGNEITTTTEETTTETTSETTTETTTETTAELSYDDEVVISRITTDEDTDEDDIYYTPCQPVYEEIYGKIDEDDAEELEFNHPILVEDEDNNAYYLVVRFDIEPRMTEDDLWTDTVIDNWIYTMFFDDFDDMLDDWMAAQTVEKNDRAIKRYNPFDIDLSY